MQVRKTCISAACLLGLVASFGFVADEDNLKGVKCLMVSKKDANKDKFSKWKEGKVYFCCDGCLGKYEKLDEEGKEKIATKANHQLVATKQYAQKGCPYSGKEIKKEFSVKVNGAEVGFCCGGCLAKTEKMKEEEQVAALFSEKAFKMAKFEPVKHEE